MSAPKLQPALLGGAFIGILSALPFVSAANVCCCLWIVAGGALAAWVMQQNHAEPVSAGDGAIVGFLAGVIGAVVYAIASAALVPLLAPLRDARIDSFLDGMPELPPEAREVAEWASAPGVGIFFGFLFHLFAGMVFATVGGALGVVVFRRSAPPPSPPPPPLPSPWGQPPAAASPPPVVPPVPPGSTDDQ